MLLTLFAHGYRADGVLAGMWMWRLAHRMRNHLELLLFYANRIKYTFHFSEAIRKWMTSFAMRIAHTVWGVKSFELSCEFASNVPYNLCYTVNCKCKRLGTSLTHFFGNFVRLFFENCHRSVVASLSLTNDYRFVSK